MKSELELAKIFQSKGYRYAIQITVNDKAFGEPLYLKSPNEAGPLLRDFKAGDHAKILWSKPIEKYIQELSQQEGSHGEANENQTVSGHHSS